MKQNSVQVFEFTGLARRFGGHWALRGAHGSLSAGEITVLSGENGSGKSTLLLLLAGILRPHSGSVRRAPGARLHLVSHQVMAYQDLTIRQNLHLAATLGGAPAGNIQGALQFWKIADLADKSLRTLSRGQLQRFLLSRALLSRADILLLDEPFTGLDAASENRLMDFMRAEARRGAALLFSEHDQSRADAIAGQTIFMQNGVCGP